MLESSFEMLAALAQRETGQDLTPSKAYLVDARLANLVRREGFASTDDLVSCLKARPNPVFEAEIAAALLARTTWFFRERDALERIVRDVLPARLKATKSGRLKIWIAGGGTGQEAYSLALRLVELSGDSGLSGARIDLLSTDISRRMTEQARDGIFGHYDVQRGLSIHRLMTHFQRLETGSWRISEALRNAVSFRVQNLLDDAAVLGQFDVIFCRHVLSDMASATRVAVADRLAAQLNPDGVLMLGHGETLSGTTTAVTPSRVVRGGWQRPEAIARTVAA
ncbi:MAG: protein-glutamate O-methyltransferase CheR [Pseudomonadota bacterium]